MVRVRAELGFGRALWRCRWSFLRIALAAFVLWVVAADLGAQAARRALAALPGFDYAGEVRTLREEGRFGEAIAIAEAGIEEFTESKRGADAAALTKLRDEVAAEQGSLLRRVKDVGWGALTGRGDSLESLAGAVVADLFVFGDLRDLAIQGVKWLTGDDPDPLIVALSAVGLATTLAPEIDWVPSLLKVARKAGALSARFAHWLLEALRASRTGAVKAALSDAGTLAKVASPAGAVRALRAVETAEDLARLAGLAQRRGKSAAVAMHVAGRETADVLVEAERLGAKSADPVRVEEAVVRAARKGEPGRKWLASGAWKKLAKPHPLVGAAKALWKGNAAALIQRALDAIGPHAWWVLPLVAVWLLLEAAYVSFRLKPAVAERRAAVRARPGGRSAR